MSLETGIKLVGTTGGKVLTTNADGQAVSSDKNIADIVTSDVTDSLDTRITALESAVSEATIKATEING